MVSAIIGELVLLARANKCSFSHDFKQKTIDTMIQSSADQSTMYQDFQARRPMEVETYLGSPCTLAEQAGIQVPRLQTLYTILRHINATNRDKPPVSAPAPEGTAPIPPPPQRMPSNGPPPAHMNGGMQMRPGPNGRGMGPPPVRNRGPPPVNGYRGPNGYPPRGQSSLARKSSFDDNNLDEFQHVVLYDDLPDGEVAGGFEGGPNASMRERELMLREKELRLREQEIAMRSRGGRRPSHAKHQPRFGIDDDDDDDDDYFDPMAASGRGPPVDDNFDMMSVTSRRTKRAPSQGQLRRGMFEGGPQMRPGSYGRPQQMGRHRTSAQLMSDMPILGANIMDNPMMGFSSNRYGAVDRKEMGDESRANSLTAVRLQDIGGGPYPGPPNRRTSRSPGNPLGPMQGPGPMGRPTGRPSPPNDQYNQGQRNGRPSPPNGIPAPMPRYPPNQGPMMNQHAVEQQAMVSKPYPPKPTKSLTGSASASAGSGDSGSANIESDPSAHSSTSSFQHRPVMGVH